MLTVIVILLVLIFWQPLLISIVQLCIILGNGIKIACLIPVFIVCMPFYAGHRAFKEPKRALLIIWEIISIPLIVFIGTFLVIATADLLGFFG